jgi:hypothetical protein
METIVEKVKGSEYKPSEWRGNTPPQHAKREVDEEVYIVQYKSH